MTNHLKYAYALTIIFLLTTCDSADRPGYISQIPDIESFTYLAFSQAELDSKKVSLTPTLLISGSADTENFVGTPFWIEKVKDEIWIADPVKGEVSAFSANGVFSRVIASRGRGPNELQYPASIYYSGQNRDTSNSVWILDSGLKSILQFSIDEGEQNRIQSKEILTEFYGTKILALENEAFLVPLTDQQNQILGVINQNGELIDGYVNRIVPLGYQPYTHNRVFFDIEPVSNQLVYAYHGLPLIFIEGFDSENKRVFDFRPETELSDYNVDLTPLPAEESISVSSITMDLFVNDSRAFFILENQLVVFNHEKEELEKSITLTDHEGIEMIFQQMVYSDGIFFLINRFTSDIYTLDEAEVTS
ncbi:6-bladed beta-propeller [Rhodohalobacter mucosus]|uniref:6-bladed beta-propeller protein n=1 Tax=Rhodohalobacter mucosus TaxID=2079485 RepID=A0A316TPV6_9BACT|nr:6-bladed beta-propeller [Rhodohalobacter mucosus]PWN05701.1 hypothetical protein DDZ15_14035 [Rhodohalobacter mucosus]